MTLVLAVILAMPVALAPHAASAGIFDFLFGGDKPQRQEPQQQQPSNAFADPFGLSNPNPAPAPAAATGGRFTTFCVRACDGRYFPLTMRGNGTPAQMCQAFCPASATKVYSGNSIDYAVGNMGERYVDTPNAFAYRKALRADCTCNGRDPAGLAPVDLALDASLKAGDVIATTDGLVAYTGVRVGNEQSFDFTPIASYPGLTAAVRARLGEMKVAPVSAEIASDAPLPETRSDVAPATPSSVVPKGHAAKPAKRAEAN